MHAISTRYGQAAATLAAQYYDSRRTEARPPSRFRAEVADPVPQEQVDKTVDWALHDDAPEDGGVAPQALDRLTQNAQRFILEPGRVTITTSTEKDPAKPKYARIPHGDNPCAFCLMLAERGAVYHSAKTAGDGNDYHNDCNCVPEPVWEGQEPSYDAQDASDMYAKARAEVGTGNTKAILAKMREMHGLH